MTRLLLYLRWLLASRRRPHSYVVGGREWIFPCPHAPRSRLERELMATVLRRH